MKNLFLITLLVSSLLCGCKSPNQTAYKTLGSIAIAVNTGKHAYEDYRATGKITAAQDATIKAAYLKYQAVFKVAQDIQAAAPGDQTGYDRALAIVAAASGDFLKAVAAFVPSFHPTP